MKSRKKVVVIGGGTGSYTLLRGLKHYPLDITAVVSMFDSGGSTGLLRDEFGVLPPGDVRRCLVALAEENGINILRELFNYRFEKESSLKGHSFGNLFLTALTHIVGSDAKAIEKAAKVLNIKGKVLPVSLTNSHLNAELEDGTVIVGESNIDIPQHNADIAIKRVYLSPEAVISEEAREAIREADIVVVGPGDLYTSLVPNFLVKGMHSALERSKAKKIFVCNIMTKWGETNGFKASDYARTLLSYAGLKKFDAIICNSTKPSRKILSAYAKEKSIPVECDAELQKYAEKIVVKEVAHSTDIIRHDSEKLAKVIFDLLEKKD